MGKKNDQKNMDLEREQAQEAVKLCECGHSKFQHIDWGNEGICGLDSCSCKKYEPGRPCNACGMEGNHPSELCVSRLRGEVTILRDLVKGQEKLLACYRLETSRGRDAALDAIAEAKAALDWK